MRLTATRRVEFSTGHRVLRDGSRCKQFHGHNYVAELTATGLDSETDPLGRTIDFGLLKQKIGAWVDEHWEGGFIVWKDDTQGLAALAQIESQKMFVLERHPTPENIARHLLDVVGPDVLRGSGITLAKVELWETPSKSVTVIGDEYARLMTLRENSNAE